MCSFFSVFLDCFAWLTTPKRKHVIKNYPFCPRVCICVLCMCICLSLYHLDTCEQKPINWIGYIQFCHIFLSHSCWFFLAFVSSTFCVLNRDEFLFDMSLIVHVSFCLSYYHYFNLMSFNNYCLLPFHTLRVWCTWTMRWFVRNELENNKTQPKRQPFTKTTTES